MLGGVKRVYCHLRMEKMGRQDMHEFHIGVGKQLTVVGVAFYIGVFYDVHGAGIYVAYSRQFCLGKFADRVKMRPGHAAQTDHSNFYLPNHVLNLCGPG